MEKIRVFGAKQHNLANIDVDFNRHQLIVVTGLSGSGKSSLVMDTVYAEGQRRYVESLSSYAKQFLGLMEKPSVSKIEGLSPAIAIDQKSTIKNPRSTVGTVTEVYDYMRLLFAHVGKPYCPHCDILVESQSLSAIIEKISKTFHEKKIILLAPIVRGKKGEHREIFEKLRREGYLRVRVNGEIVFLEDVEASPRYKINHIDLVVDRLKVSSANRDRLGDSIQMASQMGSGFLIIHSEGEDQMYSENFSCLCCGFSFKEISPRIFSFNSPYGSCSLCDGLGTQSSQNNYFLMKRYEETKSLSVKEKIENEMMSITCKKCSGKRLSQESLSIRLGEKNIAELSELSLSQLFDFLKKLQFTEEEEKIVGKVVREMQERLSFLINVGLVYLSLSRSSASLSGGEAQRIRLATQIGSGLTDVLYVLDEPSIGLHQRDSDRLIQTLKDLRDKRNTVIVIEHDKDMMMNADQIIDIGPGAGKDGGKVLYSGNYSDLLHQKGSLTASYLNGKSQIPIPSKRREGDGTFLTVRGASQYNLKNIDVSIPLGTFVCVTGVSGSGKSTLVNEIIYKGLLKSMQNSSLSTGFYKSLEGVENIDKLIVIDQKPIGRTPRSNPSTYIGMFTLIRELFARVPESLQRGYGAGRFSFNIRGGRCERCEGAGQVKFEMHFMPDVYVRCEECLGSRFNRETLEIKFKGQSIADILAMSVKEALVFFKNIPSVRRKLETLERVGLSYLSLGQSATTLSGGEAQRIKLSRELSKRAGRKTFYILDEPTTGLHFADVDRLLSILQDIVNKGNTVLVIEHNSDVIKTADFLIDLGPEGGEFGGFLVAEGTPESVLENEQSITGACLKKHGCLSQARG